MTLLNAPPTEPFLIAQNGRHRAVEPEPATRLLEELSLNAWPALQTTLYDGWLLRFSDGYTRRANSISPLYASSLNVNEKIARCESLYTARRLYPVFKMTPASCPSDLDDALARHGYRVEAPTSVRTCSLEHLEQPRLDTITLANKLSDEWLETFIRFNNVPQRNHLIMQRMLTSIIPQTCFATLYRQDKLVSLGMGVLDRGWLGLYDIITAPAFRSQGFGRQLMLHLLRWGRSRGATQAYLQVMLDNAPALGLYTRLKFQEVYTYWYRVKNAC